MNDNKPEPLREPTMSELCVVIDELHTTIDQERALREKAERKREHYHFPECTEPDHTCGCVERLYIEHSTLKDQLTACTLERERMQEALKPFAQQYRAIKTGSLTLMEQSVPIADIIGRQHLTFGDLERCQKALTTTPSTIFEDMKSVIQAACDFMNGRGDSMDCRKIIESVASKYSFGRKGVE